MSSATTNKIEITVRAQYLDSESSPSERFWFYVYQVTITNHSDKPVQLLRRHWVITNGNGEVEHVRGVGVVGEQPLILPGKFFQYTSACPMNTSMGSMHGSYTFDQDGELFEAEIAPFLLEDPTFCN